MSVERKLTDDLFVEFPAVGRKVKAGEACAVVDKPELVNTGPHGNGWFYKIKLSDAAEVNALLTPENYKAQIGG